MKILTLSLMCLFVVSMSWAQSIEKFSIDSGGNSTIAGGVQVLYTIGEVNVQEYPSVSVVVSEGFINGESLATLGVDDFEVLERKVTIYPNPTSDYIYISSEIDLTKIELYDVLGKKVFESEYLSKIPIDGYESGVYLLKLHLNDTSVIKRVIVD